MSATVLAPLTGTLTPLAQVPDPVFAQGIVGPGFAIIPAADSTIEVLSPVAGTIAKVHPHAFVVAGEDSTILVHLGLDTVKLEGEGFEVLIQAGDEVTAGQTVVRWDPTVSVEHGYHLHCPVVFLDPSFPGPDAVNFGAAIECGEPVFELS
ncbi:MAG: PTS glucose transporter subunit IIA [Actinomycetaceae bacterium]|nr:PTS glucose transporter subunit IIA [Actinomycetaceae bacterium]